ncbi:MAG: hypothetical protein HYR61_17015 [Acidobacteria bacterium]|nr:hypothetical protein [Acidobacteriota bacterium]
MIKKSLVVAMFLSALSGFAEGHDVQKMGIIQFDKIEGVECVLENKTEQVFIRIRRSSNQDLLGSIVLGKASMLLPLLKPFESRVITRTCGKTEFHECRWTSPKGRNRILLMRRLDNSLADTVFAEYKNRNVADTKVIDQIVQSITFNEDALKAFPVPPTE